MSIRLIFAPLIVILFCSCLSESAPQDVPPIETSLRGRVIDSAGNPVKMVNISTEPASSTITTGEDGSFYFPIIGHGQYILKITKEGFQATSTPFWIKEGTNTTSDIVIRKTVNLQTSLSGRILDLQTGQAIANALISTSPVSTSAVSGADGSFLISTIGQGPHTLLISKNAYEAISTKVNVVVGQNSVGDLRMEPISPLFKIAESSLNFDISLDQLSLTLINSTKIGIVNWTASTNQNWIELSTNSGTLEKIPQSVRVTIHRDQLGGFGNFTGTISFYSDAGDFHVPITVIIANPNAPQLSLISSPTVDLGNSTNSTLNFKNTGTGELRWSVQSSQTWLSLSPTSGALQSGQSASVIANINKSGLSAGSYKATAKLVSESQVVPVALSFEISSQMPDASVLQFLSNDSNRIKLGWTANTAANFQEYRLYYSKQSGVSQNDNLALNSTNKYTNTTSINGLSPSSTYYFKLFVCDNSNQCSESNEVSVITAAKPGLWIIYDQKAGVTLNNLSMLSDQLGVTYGANAAYLYDGSDWIQISNLPSGQISWMSFNPLSKKLYAVISGKIYHQSNLAWIADSLPPNKSNFQQVEFDNSGTLFAKEYGSYRIYMDRGKGWEFRDLSSSAYSLYRDYWTSQVFLSLSSNNGLMHWNNNYWETDFTNDFFSATSYYHTNNNYKVFKDRTLCVVNSYSVYTYSLLEPSKAKTFLDSEWNTCASYDGSIIFLFGSGSDMAKCSTGKCTTLRSPTSNAIRDALMTSATTGWAVGNNGTILRYQ